MSDDNDKTPCPVCLLQEWAGTILLLSEEFSIPLPPDFDAHFNSMFEMSMEFDDKICEKTDGNPPWGYEH